MGIGNDRPINIHLNQNHRAVEKAQFSSKQMQAIYMLTQRLVTTDRKEDWQSWNAERLITALKRLYPAEAVSRFQQAATRASSIQAFRLNDSLRPTNNARGKFLTVLVQALAKLGEPKHDLIGTLIREMVKGLTATTNEHRQKKATFV